MDIALNKEQQDLVEANHNLIYMFARKRNLALDDYYDILAIALCKAAGIYNKEKGKFSTIAFTCMDNEVKMIWRQDQAKSKISDNMIFSYDALMSGEDSDSKSSFLETIADTSTTHDTVLDNMMATTLLNVLNEKERQIAEYLLEGLTQTEIAERIGCSRAWVCRCVGRMRSKLNAYLTAHNYT